MAASGKAADGSSSPAETVHAALAAELRGAISGAVRFDDGARALYATDASNYRQVPIGVVEPRNADEVQAAIAVCRKHGAPILMRGAGTSLAGQCCNVAVVLDVSRHMNRILEIDPLTKTARVEPGVVLDELRRAAEQFHLTFAPDPATHTHCTLGGMIGNNSCGPHSVMAGRTSDNVIELDIATYDGQRMRVGQTTEAQFAAIVNQGGPRAALYAGLLALREQHAAQIRQRYPDIPRRVSGYNLDELLPENNFHVARALTGSEGTCVCVLGATLQLVDSPPARVLLVLGYPDIFSAADHASDLLACKALAVEGIDRALVDDMVSSGIHPQYARLLPPGDGWLLVEFGGATCEEASAQAQRVMDELGQQAGGPWMKLFTDPDEARKIWKVREASLGATAHVPGRELTWEGWEDAAVPPERLGDYLRALRLLLLRYEYRGDLYGHFGQGCVHVRVNYDLFSAPGIARWRAFISEASDLVLEFGGSLSGEHGDGQSRAEFLPKMFGDELVGAFGQFKRLWDPDSKMNPGKLVDPFRMDQNLRLGSSFQQPKVITVFRYPEDNGDVGRLSLRCVGFGACRSPRGGTMCPSYRATGDEQHSTRGRAHLLYEMLQGQVVRGGWRDEAVKEALHLCLSCKGCKHDCPVEVDMATYKAEFLSHYYQGRLRPRSAYAFGWIDRWARVASLFPTLVNRATRVPLLASLARRMAGMAGERPIPEFAPTTFQSWFAHRSERNVGQPGVLLWPDTFNNYFHPDVAKAAVTVLESLGRQVFVPRQVMCCGRPLYDFGMLGLARRRLRTILAALGPHIEAGTPMVVLEPACASVFRDDMPNLFPLDPQARRLSEQTFLLAEFLQGPMGGVELPGQKRRAVVHGHCHQKAIMSMDDDLAVLSGMGLDAELLDSGCCGMAGAFGYEHDKYDLSIAIGEHALLPALRQAAPDTLIVANGYSCREQIEHTTGRQAQHLSQVMRDALLADWKGTV